MSTRKKAKTPRKPRLSNLWKHYGPRLVNDADLLLRIYPTNDNSVISVPVIIGYPEEMRQLAKTIIAWADWAEAKEKK